MKQISLVQVQPTFPPVETVASHETIYIKSETRGSMPSTSTAIIVAASPLNENEIIVDNIKTETELQIENQSNLNLMTCSDEMTLNRLNTTAAELEIASTDSNDLKMEFGTECNMDG